MGQYHYVCNLDKREYLHPHRFGDGLKMMEFGSSGAGTLAGLTILLACSHNRGGGDLHPTDEAKAGKILGRWAGDAVVIIGDYAEDDDFEGFVASDPTHNPWAEDEDGDWRDISPEVRDVLTQDSYVEIEKPDYYDDASWGVPDFEGLQ